MSTAPILAYRAALQCEDGCTHYVGFRNGWVHPVKLEMLSEERALSALAQWEAMPEAERDQIEAWELARVQEYLDGHPDAGRCITTGGCAAKAKHSIEAVRDKTEAEKL